MGMLMDMHNMYLDWCGGVLGNEDLVNIHSHSVQTDVVDIQFISSSCSVDHQLARVFPSTEQLGITAWSKRNLPWK